MDFWRRQWFLLALVLVLVMGYFGWRTLRTITEWRLAQQLIVAGTLFCMSLPLQTSQMGQAWRRPWATILAVLCNSLLLPLLAWPIAWLLPPTLGQGLLVTATVPCTLASAAVWTRRAGGNDAIALMVTVVTNAACFLVTPFWLMVLTRTASTIDWRAMIWQLALIVVTPMAVAQLAQQVPPMGRWAFQQKGLLSTIAQVGILSMVLVGMVNCGERLASTVPVAWTDWLKMAIACASLHLLGLAVGFGAGRMTGLGREEWIAVGIAGSQKTLMIGVQTAVQYFGGLAILPMVTYHVLQLLIDTVVADRLMRRQPAGTPRTKA